MLYGEGSSRNLEHYQEKPKGNVRGGNRRERKLKKKMKELSRKGAV